MQINLLFSDWLNVSPPYRTKEKKYCQKKSIVIKISIQKNIAYFVYFHYFDH